MTGSLIKVEQPLAKPQRKDISSIRNVAGKTINEVIATYSDLKNIPFIVVLNGEGVLRKDWDRVITETDYMMVVPYPLGNQEDPDTKGITLGVLGGLSFLVGGGAWYLQYVSWLGAAGFAATGAALIYAGFTVKGLPSLDTGEQAFRGSAGSPTYDILRNEIRLRQAIPAVYGRIRVVPDYVENPVPLPFSLNNASGLVTKQLAILALSLGQVEILQRRYGDTEYSLTDSSNIPAGAVEEIISVPSNPIKNPLPEIPTHQHLNQTTNKDTHVEPEDIAAAVYQNTDPDNTAIPRLDESDTNFLDDAIGWFEVSPPHTRVDKIYPLLVMGGVDATGKVNPHARVKMVVQTIDDLGNDTTTTNPIFDANGRATISTRLGWMRGVEREQGFTTYMFPPNVSTPGLSGSRYKVKFYIEEGSESDTFGETPINLVAIFSSTAAPPFNLNTYNPYGQTSFDLNNIRGTLGRYEDITIARGIYNLKAFPFEQGAERVNYIVHRRLPQLMRDPTTNELKLIDDQFLLKMSGRTRNPVWALLDILTNELYGARVPLSRIDLNSFYDMAILLDSRQDYFDFVFDRDITIKEAIDHITTSARLILIQEGIFYRLVRDEKREHQSAMFNNANITENSMSVEYKFKVADNADGVEVEFLNEETWEEDSIIVGDIAEPVRPQRVSLTGVITKEQARRDANYIWKQTKYRRQMISFGCEAEGLIPKIGDSIVIAHDLPSLTQSGEIEDVDIGSYVLSLSGTLPPTSSPVAQGQGTERIEATDYNWGTYRLRFSQYLPAGSLSSRRTLDYQVADVGLPTIHNDVLHNGERVSYRVWSIAAAGSTIDPGIVGYYLVQYERGGFTNNLMFVPRTANTYEFNRDTRWILEGNGVEIQNIIAEGDIRSATGITSRDTGHSWFKLDGNIDQLFVDPYDATNTAPRPLTIRYRKPVKEVLDIGTSTTIPTTYDFERGSEGILVADAGRVFIDGEVIVGGNRVESGYNFTINKVIFTKDYIRIVTDNTSTNLPTRFLNFEEEYCFEFRNKENNRSIIYAIDSNSLYQLIGRINADGVAELEIAKRVATTEHDFRDLFNNADKWTDNEFTELTVEIIAKRKMVFLENTPVTVTKEYISIAKRDGTPSQLYEITRISDDSVSLVGTWGHGLLVDDTRTLSSPTGESIDIYLGNSQEKNKYTIHKGNKREKLAVIQSIETSDDLQCSITAVEDDPRIHEDT